MIEAREPRALAGGDLAEQRALLTRSSSRASLLFSVLPPCLRVGTIRRRLNETGGSRIKLRYAYLLQLHKEHVYVKESFQDYTTVLVFQSSMVVEPALGDFVGK